MRSRGQQDAQGDVVGTGHFIEVDEHGLPRVALHGAGQVITKGGQGGEIEFAAP